METTALEATIADLISEIARQDELHPAGYPPNRDGLRLAIAYASDELRETRQAHRAERCKCPVPACGHARWRKTRTEVIQTAAVLLRAARSIEEQERAIAAADPAQVPAHDSGHR